MKTTVSLSHRIGSFVNLQYLVSFFYTVGQNFFFLPIQMNITIDPKEMDPQYTKYYHGSIDKLRMAIHAVSRISSNFLVSLSITPP